MDNEPCEVPFVEQLRSVPEDFRASRVIQRADDGTPTGHQFIPVGVMFHRAAAEIERLQALRPEGRAPEWRHVPSSEDSLPDGSPVDPGTTLYAFNGAEGHWQYDLPPLPQEGSRNK